MYVLINSDCSAVPSQTKLLTSEGNALLNLLFLLGYDPMDPPFADLLRQHHHLDGEWFVLSLVHWQATHNDAMIVAWGEELHLQEHDARLWFNLFSHYLAEEGKRLHYHDAATWLLRHDASYPLNAKPVHRLRHQSFMPELAQLDESMYWQKFITESQMFFASRVGHSFVNGLWVWGGAKLKDKKKISMCVDEPFLSLAHQCSSNVTLYSPCVAIKDYQFVLLTEYSVLSDSHQAELTKMSVHWYWNNRAYLQSSGSLYARLRKLIYAD